MLRTQWGTRSPSAACISGRWWVLEVAGVVGPGRAPRAGQQTSMHHAVERDSGSGNGEDADGPANVDLKEFVASTRSQPI